MCVRVELHKPIYDHFTCSSVIVIQSSADRQPCGTLDSSLSLSARYRRRLLSVNALWLKSVPAVPAAVVSSLRQLGTHSHGAHLQIDRAHTAYTGWRPGATAADNNAPHHACVYAINAAGAIVPDTRAHAHTMTDRHISDAGRECIRVNEFRATTPLGWAY